MYLSVFLMNTFGQEMQWQPGDRPVNSVVQPPPQASNKQSPFNRSEFEVFATHTTSSAHTGDTHGDRLLEWATNKQFQTDRIRYVKMKTMGKKAVKLNIPAGVMQKDLSEPEDGCQRMVFFYRSLYDAAKQLLRCSRFRGRQYFEFEKACTAGRKRQYGAINRGEMYETCQGSAGADVSPLPVFLSSDATVICKNMGAHPIISEFIAISNVIKLNISIVLYTCRYKHIVPYTYMCIHIHAYIGPE